MSTQPNMTEPMVLPSKPEVKPMPKREAPKPKPRRGDPWTVPGPKVKPTPKAITIKAMTKSKKLISKKPSLDFIMMSMPNVTIEKLFDMFDVTPEMTSVFIASKAVIEVSSTDRMMTPQELAIQGLN